MHDIHEQSVIYHVYDTIHEKFLANMYNVERNELMDIKYKKLIDSLSMDGSNMVWMVRSLSDSYNDMNKLADDMINISKHNNCECTDFLSIGNSLFFPFYILQLKLQKMKIDNVELNYYPLSRFQHIDDYDKTYDVLKLDIMTKLDTLIKKILKAWKNKEKYILYLCDFASEGRTLINFTIIFQMLLSREYGIDQKWISRHVNPVFIIFFDAIKDIKKKIKKIRNYVKINLNIDIDEDIFANSRYIYCYEIDYIQYGADEGRCVIENKIGNLIPGKKYFTKSPECIVFMFSIYMRFMNDHIIDNCEHEIAGGSIINNYNKYADNKILYLEIKKLLVPIQKH